MNLRFRSAGSSHRFRIFWTVWHRGFSLKLDRGQCAIPKYPKAARTVRTPNLTRHCHWVILEVTGGDRLALRYGVPSRRGYTTVLLLREPTEMCQFPPRKVYLGEH